MNRKIYLLLLLVLPILLQSQTKIVYGLIDKEGKEKLSLGYDYINYGGAYLEGKYALLDFGGDILMWRILNDKKNITIHGKDYGIECFANKYFKVYKAFYTDQNDLDGIKCGIINGKGEVIVPIEYDRILFDIIGFIVCKDNRCGFINTKGQLIIPIEYSAIESPTYDAPFYYVYKPMDQKNSNPYKKKMGLFSLDGKEVFPVEYYKIDVRYRFEYDSWGIFLKETEFSDTKLGIWDNKGRELSPPIYEYIYIPSDENKEFIGYINKENKLALINYKREILTPFVYDKIEIYTKIFDEKDKDLYPIIIAQRDSIDCLLSKSGEELLTSAFISKNSRSLSAGIRDGKMVLYNLQGQSFSKKEAYAIRPLRYTRANSSHQWGAFDPEGNLVIPYMYQELDFEGNYASASFKGKYGIIDADNNIIIPFKYHYSKVINSNRCILGKRNILGMIKEVYFADMQGNPIDNNKYDNFESASYSSQMYRVTKGKKMGMCDAQGALLLACEYDDIYSGCMKLRDGKLLLEKNKKIGLYDFINKKHLTAIEYDTIGCLGESADNSPTGDIIFTNYNLVASKGKYKCLLSSTGKEITPCIYDDIKCFGKYSNSDERLYITTIDGKSGLIDITGKEISPCVYEDLKSLKGGMILAKRDDKYGVIDENNVVHLPFYYDQIKPYGNNPDLFIVAKVIEK